MGKVLICKVCNREFKGYAALGKHLKRKHNITPEEYYNKYLKNNEQEGFCEICGQRTSFRGMNVGYSRFCCTKCMMKKEEYRNIVSESKKRFWNEDPRSESTKSKIRNTIKNQWKDENSIYNLKQYRRSLSNGQKNRWDKYRKNVADQLFPYYDVKLLDNKYENSSYLHKWKCEKCGHTFNTIWDYIQSGKQCPSCGYGYGKPTSKMEKQLAEFIHSFGFEVIENSKKIIPPKEIDIYVPDKNIAIEFDGLYWHSDIRIDKNYHLNKTKLCEEKGMNLFHIFEDEWILKQEIVKERLKQILGLNNSAKIYPRNCKIKEIDPKTKNQFLDQFHLQGKDSSVIKLGAFYNDELVSVMTFSHGSISKGSKVRDNVWELNRFCTNYNYHIPGIGGKLLEHFKRNYDWNEIFTYADRRWSNGNLYFKLGFTFEYNTSPNYWYINGMNRIHRFNLRKGKNEPKDIPERILREQEGYIRIWDCGNMKFSLRNDQSLEQNKE